MSLKDAFELGTAIVTSLGGGCIAGLQSFRFSRKGVGRARIGERKEQVCPRVTNSES